MSAATKKKFYERSKEFKEQIGRLCLQEIFHLGLPYDSLLGFVFRKNVHHYLSFCEANPDYHMISYLGDKVVNRYVDEERGIYTLGDGDANPELELIVDYAALKREMFELLEAGGPERAEELAMMKKMHGMS